jgi:hypothetical protein
MRRAIVLSMVTLAAGLAAASPASAQSFEVGPRGFRVESDREAPRYREERRGYRDDSISEGEALGIARSAGLYQSVRITGGHGRVWRVTGIDRGGREIRMMIDDRTGQIVARERE